MPTRCNRVFYCRSYCLLNMFRAPLCPSSGAQEYYTVVAACGISCCGFQVVGLPHATLSSTPDQQLENHSMKYHRQQPLYNTLELLMMGIVVPETCWASNKICNKKPLLHLVGILFPQKRKLFMPVRKATWLLFISSIGNAIYSSTKKLSTVLMFLCSMYNVPKNVTNRRQ